MLNLLSAPTRFLNDLEPWIRNYSYGLLAVFAMSALMLAIVSIAARRRLIVAERSLRSLPTLSAIELTRGATEKAYTDLVSLIEALPDRGGAWWTAVRSTVERYESPDVAKGGRAGYFVTQKLEDSLLGVSSGSEGWFALFHAVPGVLTSLGLLGTFIALLIGLHGLVPNTDGSYELKGLISNLSGKFVTSIVALALSVIFLLFEIGARSAIVRTRLRLLQSLSRLLPFLSASHVLLDMQRETARQSSVLGALEQIGGQQADILKALHAVGDRQATQLERFNTDLAVSIGSAMDARIVPVLERLLQSTNELHKIQAGLGEQLLKEVGEQISGAVSGAAGKEMKSLGDAITESVRLLNGAAEAMRGGQDQLVEVTSTVIEQMNKSYGDNSKKLREETDEAVRRVVEQIGDAAGGFSTKIAGASQDVAAVLLTTSTNLRNVVEECQQIIDNTEATVQRFDGLVTAVSAATEDILTVHAALKATAQPLQMIADRTATMVGSIDRQVGSITTAAESLAATSGHLEQMQSTLGSSWRDYEKRFADVDKSLGVSLSQLKSGFDLYGEKIRDLNTGLDTHLSQALSTLSGAIETLVETFGDLEQKLPPSARGRA